MEFEKAVKIAMEAAYEDDMDQYVGLDDYHGWVVRCFEENTDDISDVFVVGVDGVVGIQKFTCAEYVEAFISNQTDTEDWRNGYPDGLSVDDICINDTVDVYYDNGSILDSGERMLLTDIDHYCGTRYPI